MELNLVRGDQAPQDPESQGRLENWAETPGCAFEVECSTCHPESAQFELRRSDFLRSMNLSDLKQFGNFVPFFMSRECSCT